MCGLLACNRGRRNRRIRPARRRAWRRPSTTMRTGFRAPPAGRSSVGAYCRSRSASAVSTRICGSASRPCADDPAADQLGRREQQGGGGQRRADHAARDRRQSAPFSPRSLFWLAPSLVFLVFLQFRARHHGDVLRPKIVGRALGNALAAPFPRWPARAWACPRGCCARRSPARRAPGRPRGRR